MSTQTAGVDLPVTVSAVVTKKDGTVIDLGVVASSATGTATATVPPKAAR